MEILYKLYFKMYRTYLQKTGRYKSYSKFLEKEEESNFKYTKLKGAVQLGYVPNLNNPIRFNEKSIHRRLFCRSPVWPIVTNKLKVRDWLVENNLHQEMNLIPILYVIKDVENFVFEKIKEPVVIKAAWASGMNIFIKNPQLENWKLVKDKLMKWQNQPYAPARLVWPATQMDREYIVEKMYSTKANALLEDYKFYVFHGQVELVQIITGRDEEPLYAHFDRDLNRLPVRRHNKGELDNTYILNPIIEEMIKVAEKIGQHFDFSRVDLYELEGEIYFGEITECPNNGYARFEPEEFDFELGKKWVYEG